MAFEHVHERKRGFYGAVPQLGIPPGLLLADGVFLLSGALFKGDWVWRVPFLISFIMVAIGVFIRMNVAESPEFKKAKADFRYRAYFPPGARYAPLRQRTQKSVRKTKE